MRKLNIFPTFYLKNVYFRSKAGSGFKFNNLSKKEKKRLKINFKKSAKIKKICKLLQNYENRVLQSAANVVLPI